MTMVLHPNILKLQEDLATLFTSWGLLEEGMWGTSRLVQLEALDNAVVARLVTPQSTASDREPRQQSERFNLSLAEREPGLDSTWVILNDRTGKEQPLGKGAEWVSVSQRADHWDFVLQQLLSNQFEFAPVEERGFWMSAWLSNILQGNVSDAAKNLADKLMEKFDIYHQRFDGLFDADGNDLMTPEQQDEHARFLQEMRDIFQALWKESRHVLDKQNPITAIYAQEREGAVPLDGGMASTKQFKEEMLRVLRLSRHAEQSIDAGLFPGGLVFYPHHKFQGDILELASSLDLAKQITPERSPQVVNIPPRSITDLDRKIARRMKVPEPLNVDTLHEQPYCRLEVAMPQQRPLLRSLLLQRFLPAELVGDFSVLVHAPIEETLRALATDVGQQRGAYFIPDGQQKQRKASGPDKSGGIMVGNWEEVRAFFEENQRRGGRGIQN